MRDTLRATLNKLSHYMQDGQRRKINKLKEKKDTYFKDLVKFIELEAKIVTNLLFGKQVFKKEEIKERINQVKTSF